MKCVTFSAMLGGPKKNASERMMVSTAAKTVFMIAGTLVDCPKTYMVDDAGVFTLKAPWKTWNASRWPAKMVLR